MNNAAVQDKLEQSLYNLENLMMMVEETYQIYSDYNEKIKKSKNTKKMVLLSSLVFHHYLYFEQILLTLRTIFEKTKTPNELSYELLFVKIKEQSDYYKIFKEIRKDYEETILKKFTNKLIAHNDAKSIGDPIMIGMNRVDYELILQARKTINKLLSMHQKYGDASINNYSQFYNYFEPLKEYWINSFKSIGSKIPKNTHV